MSLDIYLSAIVRTQVFDQNITHNLIKMASEAGLYQVMWEPSEIKEVKIAGDLIPLLSKGLDKLKKNPDHFKQFNPENGWGSYEGLVESVENYLEACKIHPDAEIYISR